MIEVLKGDLSPSLLNSTHVVDEVLRIATMLLDVTVCIIRVGGSLYSCRRLAAILTVGGRGCGALRYVLQQVRRRTIFALSDLISGHY